MMQFIPAYSNPTTNRRVILRTRPAGIPQADHFRLDEVPLDLIDAGEFRVRNIYLSVDPAQRGWSNEGTNYADPVPLNGVMRALAVGVIVESCHPDFPEGLHVYGWFGWQDYAVVGPDAVITRIESVAAPLSAYAGVLGMNGITACLALEKIGRPRAGDTVLVSTAAGAVGSLVGQLAKSAGCTVVGLTGDDAKVARCTDQFGYDKAANYKNGAIEDILQTLTPDGVDVFFDNVGGAILDAALRNMNVAGRVVQCGTASIANWTPSPVGLRNEREVLTRRLQWGGFVMFDHAAEFPAVLDRLAPQVANGQIVHNQDISVGFACALNAIANLYAGKNEGKSLIFVG